MTTATQRPRRGYVTDDAQPATLDDVVGELRGIRAAIAAANAELMQAKAAARFLGVSRSTLHRLASAETLLKPVRVGVGKRWRRADLQQYVDNLSKF